jgi:anthranilate phosphoribosyltransferase
VTDLGWPDLLSGLIAGRDLAAEQTAWAMGQILSGEAAPAQIAGFAVLLRAKGETVTEV